jgi:threonine dehydrogenase-like Zn-dependent dehydrogenase
MHAPGDVRVENRPEPAILKPTDAIIRLSATCICGSDLWAYRGFDLELPLDDAAAGYQAMHTRQAIKVLLRP